MEKRTTLVRWEFVAIAVLALCPAWWALGAEADPYQAERERMVREDIAKGELWGRTAVKDKKVLAAMREVPRHKFVAAGSEAKAYADRPLPIGYGQTISQPYIVAVMTEHLKVDADDVVLEIGTGSGYQAAVLAEIVKQVYTIEIVKQLGDQAQTRLKTLGYQNAETKVGDGYFGWPEHGPFDAIVVTAAASHIPPPLVEQLKPGGRMVIPVGSPFQVQSLVVVEKRPDGTTTQRELMPVRFVPLTGKAGGK
ncbi:MAG: protein-L-isoaspartate(D-aspartate) O-methyltransferase [Candidatus Hydrogenedentes bacterium]|nr:protein-L-isoaspartate(D-aspartate) O-methyltransferase [Candidatus Hydrogenedentota bacterium]